MLRERAFRTAKRLGIGGYLLILTTAGLAALMIGCGDSALVSETSSTVDDGTSFFDQPFDESALAKRTDIVLDDIITVEQFLPVDVGGVIIFNEVDDLTVAEAFIVQPFSFPTDTVFLVQVTKIITDDGEMPIIYDFGPDGLEFTKPALLRVNAWEDFGRKATEVVLYWLNEQTHQWEKQEVVPVDEAGNAVFTLEHFSKYGSTSKSKKDSPGDVL
jgi:hypothetical protein